MEKVKNMALLLFLAVFAASLFLNVRHFTIREQEPYRDTIITAFVDTIPYFCKPVVPKEEKPIGDITAKLPVSVPKLPEGGRNLSDSVADNTNHAPNYSHNNTEIIRDSADVVVPITQTVYEDRTYTAYVSGYRARLDSLIFLMPREVTTITNTHYQEPKRWSVGIQLGYGMSLEGTPKFAPYVGIGVSYNLFSF